MRLACALRTLRLLYVLPNPTQNSMARWFTFVTPHIHWATEITRPTLSDTIQSRKIGLPPPKAWLGYARRTRTLSRGIGHR